MTVNTYKKGQKVRCKAVFTVDEVLTDPTTVTFLVKAPGIEAVTYVYGIDGEVVRDGVGAYHVDVVGNSQHLWRYRFEGAGACEAVEESAFRIRTEF